jgi:hypothetical protein
MQNFFHIWPNYFDKFAVNPFWDLATVEIPGNRLVNGVSDTTHHAGVSGIIAMHHTLID